MIRLWQWRGGEIVFIYVFIFFSCPTQVRGDFLAFWEVWGLLPAFDRCSVGAVPRVDVFLLYLWEGRWSPRLTLPPSCPAPSLTLFWTLRFYCSRGGSFHTTWLTFSFPQLTGVWTLGSFDRDSAEVNHWDHWFCLDEWGKKSQQWSRKREREAVSYDDKISYWIRSTSLS